MKKRPIGIFDSGIGGLSVLCEIKKICPNENIVYFGDTARVPYGSKSSQTISRFATEAILFLLSLKVKLIVIACNSVSALALPALREHFNIPLIDVIDPGVEGALASTRNNRIGIIGTRATIQSRAYETKLIKKDPSLTIQSISTPLLVPLVEEDWINNDETISIITKYLNPLKQTQIDTLILGCTHYPLLKDRISQVTGKNVSLIDSAYWTAKATQQELIKRDIQNTQTKVKNEYYFSDRIETLSKQIQKYIQFPIDQLHSVSLEEGSYLKAIKV